MTFQHKHYIPILKAKKGELGALQETIPATKDMMTPLLEIINIPWDYENEEEAKTIEAHLDGLGRKILDSWGAERRIFVDSNLINNDRRMVDGLTHHLSYLFNDFRTNNLQAVPVVGLGKHSDYKNAVRGIVNSDNRGVCLRIQNADFSLPSLKQSIDDDLRVYNVTPDQVDLVFDLRNIDENFSTLLGVAVPTLINNTIPYINDWRSFTMAASSFPVNLSGIQGNTIERLDRIEWTFWSGLLSLPLIRHPSFGDYSIAHPDITDLDPRIMTISASIRYTADDTWVVVKGRSTKTHGYDQFHDLTRQLVTLPEYSGAAFSFGDQYIDDCAVRNVRCGNTTTWRIIGNNHHFQKTIVQISNLV
jgi:hypothetical protein